MMAESKLITVTKLNNTNYQSWKFKIKMLLIREGTWNTIHEDRPDRPTDDWTKEDEKAQSSISLSVEDNQIVHICKCESAKDMWDELQKVHERANLSNKLYLMRKLYQTKLRPDQDMQNYIRSALEIVERLRGIGEEILDFHIAVLLLSGLPDSYETLVTALDARPDDELTLEYVKGKLVDEYRRRSDSSTSDNLESAMKTHGYTKFKGKAARSSSKPRETRECYHCKKPGHLKRDCRFYKAKMSELEKISSQKARSAVSDAESDVAFTINVIHYRQMGGTLIQEPLVI